MSVKVTYTCDICGAVKQRSNHWFLATVMFKQNVQCIDVRSFTAELAPNRSILCGESCIHKFLSQNLTLLATPVPLFSKEQEASTAASTEYVQEHGYDVG